MPEGFARIADLPDDVLAGIGDLGWHDPMPVQERVIPLMRAGRDLIVQARTGSGKTGAFGLPIACEIDPARAEPQALVLAPTRELASQVAAEIAAMGKHRGLRTLPIYGGVGYAAQIDGLRQGAHVIVGTPGRLLDHLGSGRISFAAIRFLVLDEADELLSLGFWPDMREIHSYLPERRQSCLFSATIPEKVRSLSRVFLHEPEFVSLSEDRLAPAEIEHFFYATTAREKPEHLLRLLEYEDPESAIVFCNTKDDVRFVTSYLQRAGIDADAISGDINQAAREQAMGRIKAGALRVLVATDVAARGIDISDLPCVINYAISDQPEVYVHRTGRTGRAGKAGIAISLVSGHDIGNFRYMQNVNRLEVSERTLPNETAVLERIRARLAVKVEHELRHVPDAERRLRVERLIPMVEALAASEEGRRDLAGICASYLQEHRPETSVSDVPPRRAGETGGGEGRGRPEGRPGGRGRGRRRRPRRR
jgi:ATP-dependent RNA helicase DeaD